MTIQLDKLPPKQRQVLETIQLFMAENGYPPSIHQLCERCGVSSSATIHYHLSALKKKGFIHWNEGERRAITLHPDLEGSLESIQSQASRQKQSIPVLGSIVAGQPIMADQQSASESLDVVETLCLKDAYLLKVRGESMIEDHITDGDMVLVDPNARVRNGDVVVALVDGIETTLKHYELKAGQVTLHPANSSIQPIVRSAERVQIQGKMIALIRQV